MKNKTKKTNICAPNIEPTFTCFSKKALINISKSWNKYYKKKDNKITFKGNLSKKNIWKKLNNKLKSNCSNEYCWTTREFYKNNQSLKNLKKEIFKPIMPKEWKQNITEWLSTEDIENVLNQYELKYPEFLFIGAVPIDFDHRFSPGNCVINELCNLNIKNLIKKKKTKIGVVFNLDKHDQDGSHWVSFFCDLKSNNVYYFDSYGYNPPKEVTNLIDRIIIQGKKINKNFEVHINKLRHQYKTSECGIYSINFIENLLNKLSFKKFSSKKISDESMQSKRYDYFIS